MLHTLKLSKSFWPGIVFFLVCHGAGAASISRIKTINFKSPMVGTTLPYNVVLPVDYASSRTTRYPVLYLLHGLDGHYTDWLTRTNVADYASQYRIIIVMPEGNNSWYTDSATVAVDKYESYVLKEIVPDVQQRYRTIEARYGRAIAGLSMGGFGAFKLGLKSPGTFVFVGSVSGAFGVTRYGEKESGSSSNWNNILKIFGPAGSDTRKANDLFEIIRQLPAAQIASLPYFYFDCGTEDSPNIFEANRDLSALMIEKKIPHEFRELPGNHSWGYWDSQIQEVLRIAALKLRQPPRLRSRGAAN